MLHQTPVLRTQHAREDEMPKHVTFALRFCDRGVDHVEADFLLAGVEGGSDVVDRCCAAEEGLAELQRGEVGL